MVGSGDQAFLIEKLRDLPLVVVVKESVNTGDDLFGSLALLPSVLWYFDREALGGAAAETEVDMDVVTTLERGVFQEEAKQSLAISEGRLWVFPECLEVLDQRADLLLVVGAQGSLALLVAPVVDGAMFLQLAEATIPLGFQLGGHEPVVGIYSQVSATRLIRLIAHLLELS